MSKNDAYNEMVRQALLQSFSLELLTLMRDVCIAIRKRGEKPEDVFQRIIEGSEEAPVIILKTGMSLDEL